jgi:hypothetical protein
MNQLLVAGGCVLFAVFIFAVVILDGYYGGEYGRPGGRRVHLPRRAPSTRTWAQDATIHRIHLLDMPHPGFADIPAEAADPTPELAEVPSGFADITEEPDADAYLRHGYGFSDATGEMTRIFADGA